MQCVVCGKESGKYLLCSSCNEKRATGEVSKCSICGTWYNVNWPCPNCVKAVEGLTEASAVAAQPSAPAEPYLYEVKPSIVTANEKQYLAAIQNSVGNEYYVLPQVSLAAIINRTDAARYRNELFRNVDFLVTDLNYKPRLIVEINDQTHNTPDRRKRDERVAQICEEAGMPLLRLWTSYGVNENYIREKVTEKLSTVPVRKKHFSHADVAAQAPKVVAAPYEPYTPAAKRRGCYIATAVYGSYDCPQVWVLRRFRDGFLSEHVLGRLFIRAYYAVSPTFVRLFGGCLHQNRRLRAKLDAFAAYLRTKGYSDTPYTDR